MIDGPADMTPVPTNTSKTITCDDASQGVDVLLLLTGEEVAHALRVTEHTVENLHRTGQLRGVKVGKHRRWRLADVKRFVDGLGGDDGG